MKVVALNRSFMLGDRGKAFVSDLVWSKIQKYKRTRNLAPKSPIDNLFRFLRE